MILCNNIKIFRTFKISRLLAWVDLRRLSYEEPNKIRFVFKTETLQLIVDNPENFLKIIVKHLYQLFGAELPLKLEISPFVILPPNEPFKFKFSTLFFSYCVSMSLPENEYIYNQLVMIENEKPLKINLLHLNSDQKYNLALLSALWYSTNIQSLDVLYSPMDSFFVFLVQIVKRNRS